MDGNRAAAESLVDRFLGGAAMSSYCSTAANTSYEQGSTSAPSSQYPLAAASATAVGLSRSSSPVTCCGCNGERRRGAPVTTGSTSLRRHGAATPQSPPTRSSHERHANSATVQLQPMAEALVQLAASISPGPQANPCRKHRCLVASVDCACALEPTTSPTPCCAQTWHTCGQAVGWSHAAVPAVSPTPAASSQMPPQEGDENAEACEARISVLEERLEHMVRRLEVCVGQTGTPSSATAARGRPARQRPMSANASMLRGGGPDTAGGGGASHREWAQNGQDGRLDRCETVDDQKRSVNGKSCLDDSIVSAADSAHGTAKRARALAPTVASPTVAAPSDVASSALRPEHVAGCGFLISRLAPLLDPTKEEQQRNGFDQLKAVLGAHCAIKCLQASAKCFLARRHLGILARRAPPSNVHADTHSGDSADAQSSIGRRSPTASSVPRRRPMINDEGTAGAGSRESSVSVHAGSRRRASSALGDRARHADNPRPSCVPPLALDRVEFGEPLRQRAVPSAQPMDEAAAMGYPNTLLDQWELDNATWAQLQHLEQQQLQHFQLQQWQHMQQLQQFQQFQQFQLQQQGFLQDHFAQQQQQYHEQLCHQQLGQQSLEVTLPRADEQDAAHSSQLTRENPSQQLQRQQPQQQLQQQLPRQRVGPGQEARQQQQQLPRRRTPKAVPRPAAQVQARAAKRPQPEEEPHGEHVIGEPGQDEQEAPKARICMIAQVEATLHESPLLRAGMLASNGAASKRVGQRSCPASGRSLQDSLCGSRRSLAGAPSRALRAASPNSRSSLTSGASTPAGPRRRLSGADQTPGLAAEDASAPQRVAAPGRGGRASHSGGRLPQPRQQQNRREQTTKGPGFPYATAKEAQPQSTSPGSRPRPSLEAAHAATVSPSMEADAPPVCALPGTSGSVPANPKLFRRPSSSPSLWRGAGAKIGGATLQQQVAAPARRPTSAAAARSSTPSRLVPPAPVNGAGQLLQDTKNLHAQQWPPMSEAARGSKPRPRSAAALRAAAAA
mmetsp:Transcript_110909/g.312653  ORF Transcript_110909/g.312653 Transcript_110909/m.312653 type:complete len:1016 (+) Transcript_110909:85-3132(+)